MKKKILTLLSLACLLSIPTTAYAYDKTVKIEKAYGQNDSVAV